MGGWIVPHQGHRADVDHVDPTAGETVGLDREFGCVARLDRGGGAAERASSFAAGRWGSALVDGISDEALDGGGVVLLKVILGDE